jgi:eukaryotic-like serine/threonine-protein kinase
LRLIAQEMQGLRNAQQRAIGAYTLADLASTHGQLVASARYLATAQREDSIRGIPPRALFDSIAVAQQDAWFRNRPQRAVERLERAERVAPMERVPLVNRPYVELAIAFARAARPDRARSILAQMDAAYRDTSLRRASAPDRHRVLAEIALAENRPREAIDEFRRADVLPDGPVDDCAICLYANLARAFDLADMRDSAIVMLERYLATPYWARSFFGNRDALYLAATYKRLGELYEARGEQEKAYANYAKFVELWRNADPDLQPTVQDVRGRMARLASRRRG